MEEDKIHPLSYPITVHMDYSLDIRKFSQQKYQPWALQTFRYYAFVDFAF